ncbi:hypothetical protein XANCAGTX0491_002470 [Xanthoria calcicola]
MTAATPPFWSALGLAANCQQLTPLSSSSLFISSSLTLINCVNSTTNAPARKSVDECYFLQAHKGPVREAYPPRLKDEKFRTTQVPISLAWPTMDTPASIITLGAFALQIKTLIDKIKQHDENAQRSADRLDRLSKILQQAGTLYGQRDDGLYTPPEQKIRQAIRRLLVRCDLDLKHFKIKLNDLVRCNNWASKAWKQQTAVPDLARIEKTLADHERDFGWLVSLLHTIQTGQIKDMLIQILVILQTLTDTALNDITVADTNSLLSRATTLIVDADSAEGRGDGKSNTDKEQLAGGLASEEDSEYRDNGMRLMKAIDQRDGEDFNSLLQNNTTSLRVVDAQGQTPLLLAAHLGKERMVTSIMSCGTLTSAGNQNQVDDHRKIDLDATDALGRTVLHYCAEFDMRKAASIVLDHGVNINTPDKGEHPPMYYAIKTREYDAVKLLLFRGATKDFDQPSESTSYEIGELLKRFRQ